MAIPQEEIQKQQVAAGADEEVSWRTNFDPVTLILQQLNKLDTKIDRLDTRIDRLDTKIDDLRREVDTKVDKLDARIDKLDAKIEDLRQEMKQENLSLRQEMKQEFLALSGETKHDIRGLHQEVHGLTRWSIGVIIAVVVGLGGVIASMLAILARLP